MLCEAAPSATGGSQVLELRRVDITNSLKFHTDEPVSARGGCAAERRTTSNAVDIRFPHAGTVSWSNPIGCCSAGDVQTGHALLPAEKKVADLLASAPSAAAEWESVSYPAAEDIFYVGLPLHCLRKFIVEPGIVWGKIVAPALVELAGGRRRVDGWCLPSALLDACLFATGVLAWRQVAAGTALPRCFGSIRLGRAAQPGEPCLVRRSFADAFAARPVSTSICLGRDGDVVLSVRDYCVVWPLAIR